MITIKIEEMAVIAVKNSMLKIDRLELYINEKDKMPAWDGDIIIHKDGRQTKDDLKILRCQVKGKLSTPKQVQDRIKYSVETKHLVDYQNNGGTIFFVVYIDKKTKETLQIYYSKLLPIKIAKLLKGKEKQQKMNVMFRKFPVDEDKIMALLLDFCNQSKMQTSFAGSNTPTLEELEKQGCLEQIMIPMAFPACDANEYSIPKFFEENEMTIYATTKGNPVPIPVEYHEKIVRMTVSKTVHNPVIIGKSKYYDLYESIISADNIMIKIGNCCKIVFPNNKSNGQLPEKLDVNLSIRGTINERIKAISFIDALIKEKILFCGSRPITINPTSEALKKIGFEEFPEYTKSLLEIKSMLDELGVSKDLDLDRCTEDDCKKLGALYDIVIGHKIVYRKFSENTQFVMFEISNLNILMVCEEVNDGGYKLTNFYDAPVIFSVNDDKGNPHKTNQYLFICTDYCKKADNYSITKVVEGIKSVFDDDNNIYQASYIADDMIKMFDETGQQSYLDVAESIDELLLTRTDIIEEESIVIDKIQITYRQRKLSFSEKKILSVIATKSEDNFCKLSAFVLLGEKVEADSIISVISDNEKEALLKAPIYNLYKKLEATQNGQTKNAHP